MEADHLGRMLPAMACSDEIFSMCSGKRKSEFYRRVVALSKGLQALGLECGDRVAIAAFNSDLYLEWMLAVPCAGGILAPLNYRWSLGEANEALQLIQPAILVVDRQCSHWCKSLRISCPSIRFQIIFGSEDEDDCFLDIESIMQQFMGATELELRHAPHGTALICFTSGTTGTPKGVCLSHKALVVQSLAKLNVVGYTNEDVYLHTAPLCHIGGVSSALAMLMAGSRHVFLPKFEVGALLKALKIYSISTMIVVPTMLRDIVNFRACEDDKIFPKMATILNGGGQIPLRVFQVVEIMFPNAKIFSAYGMTEAASSITFAQVTRDVLQSINADGVCVGRPASHVQIKIRNGIRGNVLTRGPHVMRGYWRQLKETRKVLSYDGWLDTEDVGSIDEAGNLWLFGRAKDVIKTGGENVYASEVETLIAQHPSVAMVAVVGVPDHRLGEKLAAVVMLKDGWAWRDSRSTSRVRHFSVAVSAADLQRHCHDSGLSRYKIPKLIVQQDTPLPMTSTGKIRKDVVKAAIVSALECEDSISSRL